MQLVLYKNLSSDNTINKVLTNRTVFNINLKRETDILNPDLFLVKQVGIDYKDFNYAEIVEFGRFYFINSISSVNVSLFKLECSTDVLETYKTTILNSNARYNRNLKTGDYQTLTIESSSKTDITLFESDIELPEGETIIMTTIGGGADGI